MGDGDGPDQMALIVAPQSDLLTILELAKIQNTNTGLTISVNATVSGMSEANADAIKSIAISTYEIPAKQQTHRHVVSAAVVIFIVGMMAQGKLSDSAIHAIEVISAALIGIGGVVRTAKVIKEPKK